MSEMEQARKITALEKEVQELKSQLKEHNGTVNRKLEIYNSKLADTANESHVIKHTLEGLSGNFLSFTRMFDTNQQLLRNIHETLLSANYEKRISMLEVHASDSKAFQISVKTTVEVIKSVGIIQVVTIIIGVTAAIIKFVLLK